MPATSARHDEPIAEDTRPQSTIHFPNSSEDMNPHSRGANCARVVLRTTLEIKRAQGMPGALAAPVASRGDERNHASQVTTGTPRSPAFPARWFYDFLRALPGDQALLPPSPAKRLADLTPALGRQNHTSSSSADQRGSSAAPSASIASPLHVRDDAHAPLAGAGWATQ